MDGASVTFGEEEKCVQGFGGKTWREREMWKTKA